MKFLSKLNSKVFFSLLLTYLFTAICPALFIVFFSYKNYREYVANQVMEVNISGLKKVQSSVELVFDKTKEISIFLISSNNILDLNNINKSNITDIEKIITIHEAQNELLSYTRTSNFIYSIYIYNKDENMIFTSDAHSVLLNNFYDNNWISQTTNIGNEGKWLDARKTLNKEILNDRDRFDLYISWGMRDINVISFVKTISHYMAPFEGYVVVNIDEEKLSSWIKSIYTFKTGDIFILNKDGIVILSNNKSDIYKPFCDNLHDLLNNNESEYFFLDNGKRRFICYYTFAGNGWIYVLQKPFNDYIVFSKDIVKYLLYLIIIFIIISICISIYFSSKFYYKIDGVINTIKRINKYEKDKINEFELINNTLNRLFRESRGLEEYIESNTKIIKENYIQILFSGELSNGNEIIEKLKYINIYLDKEYFAVDILKIKYIENSFIEKRDIRMLQKLLIKICETILDRRIVCIGTSLDVSKIGILINADNINSIKDFSSKIIEKVKIKLNIDAYIVVGGRYRDFVKIEKSYSDALNILRNKVLVKVDDVIMYDEIHAVHMKIQRYPFELQEKVIYYLKITDLDQVKIHFDKYLDNIFSNCESNKNQLEDDCILLLSSIVRAVEMFGYNLKKILNINNIYRNFLENDDRLSDIKEWFYRSFEKIVAEKVFCSSEDHEKYRDMIKTYIEKHYNDELSLEMVAEKIGISYSYLRKIFKKIFKCSFSQYLNNKRIEKTKELLIIKDKKISEIIYIVGYNNEQSFFRNFKKIAGCTPEEYRREYLYYA